jgi:K+-sensing histidine kinase KdpD
MLQAAVFDLLHNAFKFAQRRTEVTLRAYAAAERVLDFPITLQLSVL